MQDPKLPTTGGTVAGTASCTFSEAVLPSGFVVINVAFEVTGTISDITSSVQCQRR